MRGRDDWQPIETAPRSGEMVLVGGLNWTDDWWMNFAHIDGDGTPYGDWHYDLEPTHWHALPPPPALEQRKTVEVGGE